MKIAHVCPYDIDRPGGVQTHILDTAAALRDLGHEVVVIAPGSGGRPDAGIIRIGRFRKITLGGTSYEISIALGGERKKLAALMRAGNFDVVHYHTVWTPFVAPQALAYSSAPAIATFHDTTADTATGRLMRMMFRWASRRLLPRFEAVITPSDAPKGSLDTRGRQIIVMPPCTDLRRFMAAPAAATPFHDGRINILFLGRLEPRKGAGLLLQAFQMLQGEGLKLRLILAGSGPEEAALRAAVAKQAIANVEFTGAFAAAGTPKWFAAADIFCAPSPHGESFGIVVVEAMASGKPVVAAGNPGYRTILTGEAANFLTPPGDVAALRDALRTLAGDSGLRVRLGEWGRDEALRYDCRAWAPRFVALYEQAVASAKARTAT